MSNLCSQKAGSTFSLSQRRPALDESLIEDAQAFCFHHNSRFCSSHEIPENPRSLRRPAHHRAGDATTVVSYQGHPHRKIDRPAQARRVLVETTALAERSAHGVGEHRTEDHVRLSYLHT